MSSDEIVSDNGNDGPTALAQVMRNILASSASAKKNESRILGKAGVEEKIAEKTDNEKSSLRHKREARRKRELVRIAWERMGMVKPTIEEKDKERNLAKIATKGVVQLFNAVATQQDRLRSKLSEEGTTDVKRSKIVDSLSRSSFIDLLKSQSGLKSNNLTAEGAPKAAAAKKEPRTEKQQTKAEPKWKVLQDNFAKSEFASGLGAESDGEIKPEPF